MSIESEINRIKQNIANAYTNCSEKGGTLPQIQDSANLAATVSSVPSGASLDDYYTTNLSGGNVSIPGILYSIKSVPTNFVCNSDMSYTFYNCRGLTTAPLLNTSSVTDMSYMFGDCSALTTVPQFNTSSVTTMSYMFSGCINLTTIPQFDTSRVGYMGSMFSGCSNLTTVPLLNTSGVINMSSMFFQCNSKLTTVPQFDTSSATNMSNMFASCGKLTTVPQFDISSATNLTGMFSSCSRLSNESLNNIMAMCIGATSYTGTKTLKRLGLSNLQATTCTGLSNYNDFIDAGWTTGY